MGINCLKGKPNAVYIYTHTYMCLCIVHTYIVYITMYSSTLYVYTYYTAIKRNKINSDACYKDEAQKHHAR